MNVAEFPKQTDPNDQTGDGTDANTDAASQFVPTMPDLPDTGAEMLPRRTNEVTEGDAMGLTEKHDIHDEELVRTHVQNNFQTSQRMAQTLGNAKLIPYPTTTN